MTRVGKVSGSDVRELNEKPSRREREGCDGVTSGLGADYVTRLKAFGAFEQIELHGLTLVERAVTVFLNRGEMHENIFSRGALDKAISLRPVEPLHCSLLSHRKTPFPDHQELVPRLSRIVAPPESANGTPPQEIQSNPVASRAAEISAGEIAPKAKDS